MVDIGRTKGEQAEVGELELHCRLKFAAMMPDQRAMNLSGGLRMNIRNVSSRPLLFETKSEEVGYDGMNIPAQAWISPDCQTVLYDLGEIWSVSH